MRVAVTYQAELLPPRTVFLAEVFYREPTAADPPAPPGIAVLPKDDAAQVAEDDAIRQDIAALQEAAPPTRDL